MAFVCKISSQLIQSKVKMKNSADNEIFNQLFNLLVNTKTVLFPLINTTVFLPQVSIEKCKWIACERTKTCSENLIVNGIKLPSQNVYLLLAFKFLHNKHETHLNLIFNCIVFCTISFMRMCNISSSSSQI